MAGIFEDQLGFLDGQAGLQFGLDRFGGAGEPHQYGTIHGIDRQSIGERLVPLLAADTGGLRLVKRQRFERRLRA